MTIHKNVKSSMFHHVIEYLNAVSLSVNNRQSVDFHGRVFNGLIYFSIVL